MLIRSSSGLYLLNLVIDRTAHDARMTNIDKAIGRVTT